jgi:magnesium transporter
MLSVRFPRGLALEQQVIEAGGTVPENAVWIDLLSPRSAEDKRAEQALGISVPTREEMQEIEPTNRLYVENGARYMTATLMCRSETDNPTTPAMTFVLAGHRLITVRYDQPRWSLRFTA